MTISSETRKAGPFNGNGVTTSFPFTFKVFSAGDITVVRTMPSGLEETLVLNSDYSVTLNADQDANPGGTITYPVSGTPLPTGWRLTAVGDLDNLQPTDITNGGGFYPQVIENALDRVTMLLQQLDEELDRTIRIAVSDDATTGLELPVKALRAGKFLMFDDNGDPTVEGSIGVYYYGALASDPAARPNGSAVNKGDYYFNTTLSAMLAYNGTTWGSASAESSFTPTQVGTLERVANATTPFALTLLDDADAAAMRTTIGAAPASTTYTKVEVDGIAAQATETTLGRAELATQAETDAGTDDLRIVTPKKLRWGVNMSLGASGYLLLPTWLGGVCLQWGSVAVAGSLTTASFNVAFPTSCYQVFVSPRGAASTPVSAYARVLSASQFQYASSNGDSNGIAWFAVGK